MNLLILEKDEPGILIPRADRRYEHIRKILKKEAGDFLEAGIATDEPFGSVPGNLGKAQISELNETGLILTYEAMSESEALAPLRLVLGFPRPIQANRIFKDLVSLGLSEIWLSGTELGEKSYLESTFFRSKEYRRPLIEGAEQAANPRLPIVSQYWTLQRCLEDLRNTNMRMPTGKDSPEWDKGLFIALHPASGAQNLGTFIYDNEYSKHGSSSTLPITLAIGSERGWTEREVEELQSRGFIICNLGKRILKTETASVASVSLCLAALGRM